MCGIAGTLNFDVLRPADGALVQRMTSAMVHRGPDGCGHLVRGPVALGHRRLAIIDLNTGAQPLSNEDGSVWVTFNGEIYNFRELRADLRRQGHVFKTDSDTEVIVHLYEQYGEDCVAHLKGMFAFAIWDEPRQRLFLARDRLGIKPLYYAQTASALLFASEIKALLQEPTLPRRFAPAAIDRFLTYYYLPGAGTLFEGISRLEPGHCLTVVGNRVRKRRYWDIDFTGPRFAGKFDDAVQELRDRLSRSVSSHLMSDVPVGVLLSGGVDSTGVLRYAAEHSASTVRSFTIGFAGQSFADERPYARLAANVFGAEHHVMTMDASQFGALLPLYTWHMEEPVCEPPAIAMYAVSQMARQQSVKVLLSGEGGDEAFGGYNKYAYLLALEGAKSALGHARGLLRPSMRLLARLGAPSLRHFIPLIDRSLPDYYLSCTSSPYTLFGRTKDALYTTSMRDAIAQSVAEAPTRDLFARLAGLGRLHQMLHVDTKTWLPDDLLIKADKMTMAASVELRVPLLDTDIMEFAAALPASFKIRGWPPKRVLRAALADSIPAAILKRKKIGFPVPYDGWLRHELKAQVDELLFDAPMQDYFDRDAVRSIVDAHRRGEGGAQEVFGMVVLSLLHRQFISASSLGADGDQGLIPCGDAHEHG